MQEGCQILVMDAEGSPLREGIEQTECFVLSDHKPFNEDEMSLLSRFGKVSIGSQWLQGHACIAIVHHILDGI